MSTPLLRTDLWDAKCTSLKPILNVLHHLDGFPVGTQTLL